MTAQPYPAALAPTSDDDDLAAWLRLAEVRGMRVPAALALLRAFGVPQRIFAQTRSDLAAVAGERLASALLQAPGTAFDARAAQAAAWAATGDQHLLTLADPRYPAPLLTIPDPPLLLYMKGQLARFAAPGVAIVGSRHATAQGKATALALACALSEAGLTVVSGLAQGIDGAAHRGALRGPGGTIAVLGTGVDRVYPACHRELAAEIGAQGALVAEWPLGTPPRRENFPQRNRLIAGLSRGVVVVEAAIHSGSLITARLAGEFGRDVLAVPGSIHSPLTKGCHRLIKQGAQLVESAADVFEALGLGAGAAAGGSASGVAAGGTRADTVPSRTPTGGQADGHADGQADGLSPTARRVLTVIGYDPLARDELAGRAALGDPALQAVLLELELAGHISTLPGARVVRMPPLQQV